MTHVEQYLRKTIGLDSASIGSSSIQRSVRLRMKSRGIRRLEDYVRLIATSPHERDELVESVVVTETWFFRDHEPFCAFVGVVFDEWLPAHPASQLRVLSIPCASGEEPYSLAIALLEAGLPRDRFDIEGVDLSARALARAQRAIFKKNSFRGQDLSFRDRHFRDTCDGYVLSLQVRECVHFHQANLLDDGFLAGRAVYDFIFCRNLLIYFDRLTQRKALEKIRRLLSPSGVFWVGAAEHPIVTELGFVSAQIPRAFACRHAGQAASKQLDRPAKAVSRFAASANTGPAQTAVHRLAPGTGRGREAVERVPAGPPSSGARPSLEAARRLADGGRLQDAIEMCDLLLRQNGASAEVYYLSGLVRDAAGDPGALDCYRKALYLEPGHYETLLQMALWSEKDGDFARARTYKDRALRAKTKVPIESLA